MAQKVHPKKGWKTLSSKRGNMNYYKGRGGESAGVLNSKGQFFVLPSRTPHYILPRFSLWAPRVRTAALVVSSLTRAYFVCEQCVANVQCSVGDTC